MKKINEIELLGELISIDSSNPGPYESEIANFLADLAKEFGFETQIFESIPGRSNLIITISAGSGAKLGFSGHIDTKPVGDLSMWRTPPWEFVKEGDLGFGLGSSDMKAGVAAMFVAATEWAIEAKSGTLKLIFTADEEAGSVHGSEFISKNIPLDLDAILVGEPSGVTVPWESIFTVSRGISCFEITILGKQGHSGLSNTLPTSTAIGMAKAILAISNMNLTFTRSENALMVPTINSGVTVSGGITYGVHPGESKFKCDIRLIPGMTKENLENDLKIAIDSSLPADLTWQIKWEDGFGWMDAVQIPDSHPLVLASQEAVQKILGRQIPLGTYPGGTDASHFYKIANIPTVASLGPGWLSVAHAPNECVGLSQVTEAKNMYVLIANNFLDIKKL
jgi:acetylornithine deacetylase/succinyl-diaminopimelate desuccinylase-like protein